MRETVDPNKLKRELSGEGVAPILDWAQINQNRGSRFQANFF
jgi:hypothetical protein